MNGLMLVAAILEKGKQEKEFPGLERRETRGTHRLLRFEIRTGDPGHPPNNFHRGAESNRAATMSF